MAQTQNGVPTREAWLAACERDDQDEINRLWDAAMKSAPQIIQAAAQGKVAAVRRRLKKEPGSAHAIMEVTGDSMLTVASCRGETEIVRTLWFV